MEVATLQPQDCLQRNHFHQRRPLLSPPNNKPRRNVNFNTNTNPNVNVNVNGNANGNFNSRSNRKRRNSTSPPPSSNGSTTHAHKAQHQRPKSPPSPPQHGQVRILKRGEQISPSSPPPPPPQPEPMSEPADVHTMPVPRMVDGFYAGSAFVTSPAPSEVPLPAFFTKRNCGFASGDVHNQEIACELRRVLKLH